jgi:hypothetical protein
VLDPPIEVPFLNFLAHHHSALLDPSHRDPFSQDLYPRPHHDQSCPCAENIYNKPIRSSGHIRTKARPTT